MNYKIEGSLRRNKKYFIIFAILWLFIAIVLIVPFTLGINVVEIENGGIPTVSEIEKKTRKKISSWGESEDMYSKQEGVPFNISLGGGTQGLCDVIYLDYRKLPEYEFPLEKEFAGTFIGYIKALRIYNCGITFSEIVQNAIFDGYF